MSCRRKAGRHRLRRLAVQALALVRAAFWTTARRLQSQKFRGEVERCTCERHCHTCGGDETTWGTGGAGSTTMQNPDSKTSKRTWESGQRNNRKAKRNKAGG